MKPLSLFILFILSFNLSAQLTGIITDEQGTPLSYVNIYVANTSNGTTSNNEGYYELELTEGSYDINFQYVGYELKTEKVKIDSEKLLLNIILQQDNYKLEEITINADAEDPAYAIIRKAQAKRKYHRDLYSNYSCDAYMKGFNKVNSAPEKIMGMEVGDFDGALDSTRSGVVYLSETVSKLYFKEGKSKEIIYSSKVSGDVQGYSFNSAQEMDFNFYHNTLEFNKEVVSPIARNAMSHYRYKLEGANPDKNGQLINKIKVIQKNEVGNSFFGHIYINEDLWNIHSVDLNLTKHATQVPVLDTVNFKQVYAPLSKEKWILLSNYIQFKIGTLGFQFEGNFATVYSNYEEGNVKDETFDKVTFKVEEEANTRTNTYWDSIRPMPLTLEEKLDYHRKDSIRIVRESPEHLDSMDRVENRFKLKDLLIGYTNQNSKKQRTIKFLSPLGRIRLNTVQGLSIGSALEYKKTLDKKKRRSYSAALNFDYGLSEKVFRPNLAFIYRHNRLNNLKINMEGGTKLSQYSRLNPITDRLNGIFTYFFRENYMKLYEKHYATIAVSRDLASGLSGSLSVDYEDRTAVVNNFAGGLMQESKDYSSNNPQNTQNDDPAFLPHQALILRANLRINIGQKIWSYPDRNYKENSAWPTLSLHYKGGLPTLGSDVEYHILYAQLYKEWEASIYGTFDFNLSVGNFLGDNKPEQFIDFMHFNGNQTHIGYPPSYSFSFLIKPYYQNSTDDNFLALHVQHKFDGFLLDKVPLLKRLGWELVAGYKYLDTDTIYEEIHIGLDNIGYKAFRILRLDLVYSKRGCHDGSLCATSWKPSIVVGAQIKI